MKRLLALLLCLSIVLALAGCHTEPNPTEPENTVPSTQTDPTERTEPSSEATEDTSEATEDTMPSEETEPPVTEPIVFDLPVSAVVLTSQDEVTSDEDGKTVFTYTYQDVRLYLTDDRISEDVTLDLLNRIDATRPVADQVLNNGGTGYSVIYTPQRIDAGVMSLSGVQNSYSGGGHPHSVCIGATYNLLTGEFLTLADVITENCTAEVLCRLVVDALGAVADQYFLYSDYSATAEDRFSGDYLSDKAWYLSGEGLCFDFAPYEVAPYSAGIVTAVVPYSELYGILNDAYFPVEQISAEGELSAILYADADQSLIDQCAEVILEPEGECFLLYPSGLVYELTIETGQWDMDGIIFTPEAVVFAADHLTVGNAVMVQTYVPDVMPNIRITYHTGSGEVQLYLSQSGEDGSALLLPMA